MTMSRLPNTGEAVIIDLGEGKDIHPRNKQDVADAAGAVGAGRDYGMKLAFQSPTYQVDGEAGQQDRLHFDHVGGGLKAVRRCRGSRIRHRRQRPQVRAGPRRKITRPGNDRGLVRQVSEPVAVRYAWADNPVCNVYSDEGLPLTPFRTDDWPGVTINNN